MQNRNSDRDKSTGTGHQDLLRQTSHRNTKRISANFPAEFGTGDDDNEFDGIADDAAAVPTTPSPKTVTRVRRKCMSLVAISEVKPPPQQQIDTKALKSSVEAQKKKRERLRKTLTNIAKMPAEEIVLTSQIYLEAKYSSEEERASLGRPQESPKNSNNSLLFESAVRDIVNSIKTKRNKRKNQTSSSDDANNKSRRPSVELRKASPVKENKRRPSSDGAPVDDYSCLCLNYSSDKSVRKGVMLDQRNYISAARMHQLRRMAYDASKAHKTFTIRGCFYSIRKSLLERGWVEKFDVHRRSSGQPYCQQNKADYELTLPERKPGQTTNSYVFKCERNIVSRYLEHKPIDFLWCARKERSDYSDMIKNPGMMVSRLNRNPFTSKSGMCNVLREFHWFFEEGTSEMYYPRSFNTFLPDDLADFVDNFRMSSCIALLRFIVEDAQTPAVEGSDEASKCTKKRTIVPCSAIKFAIDRCIWYVQSSMHLDIDVDPPFQLDAEHEWELFLRHHQILTVEGGCIEPHPQFKSLLCQATAVLMEIEPHWAQYNLDGGRNIWIVKPSNRCRGRGIRLMNDLPKILDFVQPSATLQRGNWVVQKYIERPLIIHNCKFDIRQWFLVTSVQPMVIWMYRECYLRFSSQEFSLANFHESVHLTNHAVQKRYRNGGTRDKRLPKENMWDCHTFQAYLRQIGQTDQWTDRIYPGMQKAVIGTMLASQDLMDRRSNTFELFGADFMVSEDFQPWLIEINSSPDLGASTSVTARMCPQCLEDLVKVVVDYRANPKSPTGEFELIYKQNIPAAPAYLGLDLFLVGTPLIDKTLKKVPSLTTITTPRNTCWQAPVQRKVRRPGRTPMSIVRSPHKSSDTSRQPTVPEQSQSPIVKPIPAKTTRSTRRVSKSCESKSSESKPSGFEIHVEHCSPDRQRALAYTDPYRPRSNNRFLCNVMTPAMRVMRELRKRELEARRRHTSCGPRLFEIEGLPTVQSSARSGSVELKCVGKKVGAQDASKDETKPNDECDSKTPRRMPFGFARRQSNTSRKEKSKTKLDPVGGESRGLSNERASSRRSRKHVQCLFK